MEDVEDEEEEEEEEEEVEAVEESVCERERWTVPGVVGDAGEEPGAVKSVDNAAGAVAADSNDDAEEEVEEGSDEADRSPPEDDNRLSTVDEFDPGAVMV